MRKQAIPRPTICAMSTAMREALLLAQAPEAKATAAEAIRTQERQA